MGQTFRAVLNQDPQKKNIAEDIAKMGYRNWDEKNVKHSKSINSLRSKK